MLAYEEGPCARDTQGHADDHGECCGETGHPLTSAEVVTQHGGTDQDGEVRGVDVVPGAPA